MALFFNAKCVYEFKAVASKELSILREISDKNNHLPPRYT